jgi:PBP1b-binding outer membrane lipoprotein LpoB
MKNTLVILLSAFLLFGCSNKHADDGDRQPETRQSLQQSTQGPRVQDQAPSAVPAIDLVKAGEDVAWSDGYVLHVARRDGASLGGIRITCKGKDGQVTTTTADKGTVSNSGAAESHGVLYTNFVRITLENAHAQGADGTVKGYKQARFFLHQ